MSVSTAAAPLSLHDEAFVQQLEHTRAAHPGNRAARFATRAVFESLSADQRAQLRRCCQSGAAQPDSDVGCCLLQPSDVHELGAFFGPLIRDYHHAAVGATPPNPWPLDTADPIDVIDLAALGWAPVSMRVRVARNVEAFRLPASMNRAERLRFKTVMGHSLQTLIDHPDYGGRIYSLHPQVASPPEHQTLVATGAMFRDMTRDRFMNSAGLAGEWPHGRACYVSRDRELIIWIGEEDHLRIICMKTGTRLNEVFDRLRACVRVIESLPGMTFTWDAQFGYITSCPSNLGTGMRASLHVNVPTLMRQGIDIRKVCAQAGLNVCGPGGERTPCGTGGVLEVSPMRGAFVRESDIIRNLYEGVRRLSEWVAV